MYQNIELVLGSVNLKDQFSLDKTLTLKEDCIVQLWCNLIHWRELRESRLLAPSVRGRRFSVLFTQFRPRPG